MSEKLLSKEALEAIEKLADIVNNKELEEVTIANGDNVITVKGRRCPPPMPMGMPPFQHDMMPVTMNAAAAGAAPTVEAQNRCESSYRRNFLRRSRPEQAAFRRGRQARQEGRRSYDNRIDEAHERDHKRI